MNITERKIVYNGKKYKLSQLTVQDGDKSYQRERFEPGKAVGALVFDTQKQRYLMVKQFRVGSESDLIEVPAGMLDQEGESPEQAMRREIEEELGYTVDHIEPISTYYPSAGASAEQISLFYAEVSQQTSDGGGVDEGEKITTIEFTKEELSTTKFEDGKAIIAVQWLRLRNQ
ncbi:MULTISPECIES: NUDIX domain-containing protein [Hymenobacter]|uniref:GDP-mannose pyrophosphatase n=1 Tax=Hymenobacter jejuensis TaxID=2502781 RepID=A0A5B8A677_9BACT|nr:MULTISPECIES: NUDIX hydrolase [Hymenobacter]MBC6989739.1 NUDIX hydrolase [Hymenobacter sp. BT491]QDA61792.1 NUDIX hydrolase [Hymenobacter jejuensis]